MTTKLQYEAVLLAESDVSDYLHSLNTYIADTDLILSDQVTLIENALVVIRNAAQEKLDQLAQEQVMLGFLAEMKLVFEKYGAKIEFTPEADGYGEDYGNASTESTVTITATFDGVTALREIEGNSITSGELV